LLLKEWNTAVKEVLVPSLQEDALEDKLSEENAKALELNWLNRLFQKGKINLIFDQFKVSESYTLILNRF
jgi:hypothetical protein